MSLMKQISLSFFHHNEVNFLFGVSLKENDGYLKKNNRIARRRAKALEENTFNLFAKTKRYLSPRANNLGTRGMEQFILSRWRIDNPPIDTILGKREPLSPDRKNPSSHLFRKWIESNREVDTTRRFPRLFDELNQLWTKSGGKPIKNGSSFAPVIILKYPRVVKKLGFRW